MQKCTNFTTYYQQYFVQKGECRTNGLFSLTYCQQYDIMESRKANGHEKQTQLKEIKIMSVNEMVSKVRTLKELEAFIAEAQAEAETIKDELKAQMNKQHTEELIVDVYKIRYTTVSSDRIDTTAFKKALPDLAKQFTKTSTTRRFIIA